jgi:hypothetical protein
VSGVEVSPKTTPLPKERTISGTLLIMIDSLAYAELYLTIAMLVTRYDYELFETTIEDVEFLHDWTLPYPKLDSKLIRVLVKERGPSQ